MNPAGNTPNTNTNLNQPNTGANNGPFVTPTPIGFSVPQTPVSPAVNVQNTVSAPNPVSPTPMPAPQVQTPVSPTPMPAPVTPSPVTPTPMANVAQPVTPQVVTQNTVASEITKEDPNAKIAEINIPPASGVANEPEVINTVKSKGSNFILFLVIAILVAFAINIDKVAEMVNNYMETGSLTSTTVTPDNTTGGFIKIDESSSSMKISEINFYNFRKNISELTISFNFESFATYEDTKALNLYIEIYNADKELLYKELFDAKEKIDKNTTSNYTMKLDSDVFEGAFYALVKTYTDTEMTETSELTCSFVDNSYEIINKYHFTNNELVSYDVTKKSNDVADSKLQEEYNELNEKVKATYQNNTLTYTVDLNSENGISPIYPKGLTPTIVKSRDTLKKWECK